MRREPRRHRHRGFTLIELVVVLLILGLISGFAVLAVGDSGRGRVLTEKATELKGLIELAGQTAILRGQEVGAAFSDDGYRFLILEGNEWSALSHDRMFRDRQLPDGVSLDLFLENAFGTPPELAIDGGPQVVFFSSGEATPFTLKLYDQHSSLAYVLTETGIGEIGLTETEMVR